MEGIPKKEGFWITVDGRDFSVSGSSILDGFHKKDIINKWGKWVTLFIIIIPSPLCTQIARNEYTATLKNYIGPNYIGTLGVPEIGCAGKFI